MAKTSTQLIEPSSGRILADSLDRPRTFIGRGIGLMFRRSLPAGRGMLIDPCNGIHMLFMRFAIDAVFLDRRGRVVRAISELRPWRATRFHLGAVQVVELPAGSLARSGTREGDELSFEPRPAV